MHTLPKCFMKSHSQYSQTFHGMTLLVEICINERYKYMPSHVITSPTQNFISRNDL